MQVVESWDGSTSALPVVRFITNQYLSFLGRCPSDRDEAFVPRCRHQDAALGMGLWQLQLQWVVWIWSRHPITNGNSPK